MNRSITLDDIKEATAAKYRGLDVQLTKTRSVELRNVMRLPKEQRAKVFELQQTANQEDENGNTDIEAAEQAVWDMIALVIGNQDDYEALVAAIDGDFATAQQILGEYGEATAVGEAVDSAD